MPITAKVTCAAKTEQGGGDSRSARVTFTPDYPDDRNREWWLATPHLALEMTTLRGDVANQFEPGEHYTLTFDKAADGTVPA